MSVIEDILMQKFNSSHYNIDIAKKVAYLLKQQNKPVAQQNKNNKNIFIVGDFPSIYIGIVNYLKNDKSDIQIKLKISKYKEARKELIQNNNTDSIEFKKIQVETSYILAKIVKYIDSQIAELDTINLFNKSANVVSTLLDPGVMNSKILVVKNFHHILLSSCNIEPLKDLLTLLKTRSGYINIIHSQKEIGEKEFIDMFKRYSKKVSAETIKQIIEEIKDITNFQNEYFNITQ